MNTKSHKEQPITTPNQRLHAIVHGRVQGVNFRHNTQQKALSKELTGWVCNRSDGTVEVIAEGPRTDLDKLAAWLRQGPPAAHVTNVDITWRDATGDFDSFQVTYRCA